MSDKASTQYLQRYAEAEIASLTHWPTAYRYQHTVLIPAYQETADFLHNALRSRWFNRSVLLILIINQPTNDQDSAAQQALYDAAFQCGKTLWQSANLSLIAPHLVATDHNPSHLLVINRFQRPLAAKQGVGLARKIGADLALALIQRGVIQSDWICSTDADATLPDDYFAALALVPDKAVAACYHFTHTQDKKEDENREIAAATLLHEQAMRYYVAGLRYAGSSYAHFTIGSILTFKAKAYAQARGFPKRAAGEDFYLLNKLVKLGEVAQVETTVQLQARLSNRVPFGTGVSTAKIMQLTRAGEPFRYYHPQIFAELRLLLNRFDRLWTELDDVEQWSDDLTQTSLQALLTLGFDSTLEKLQRQHLQKPQFNWQLTGWFDGLKTLRFIHLLRDSAYPNLPLEQAIQQAEFTVTS